MAFRIWGNKSSSQLGCVTLGLTGSWIEFASAQVAAYTGTIIHTYKSLPPQPLSRGGMCDSHWRSCAPVRVGFRSSETHLIQPLVNLNVGLRLYNHALTEVYAKVPKCDSTEQLNLQSSTASLRPQNDPVMRSGKHKYSFEQGYTPMGTGSVGIGDPACQYRERKANLWVTPQAGLKGIAHTVSLVWYGPGGHTPGVITLGSTVEVNIQ